MKTFLFAAVLFGQSQCLFLSLLSSLLCTLSISQDSRCWDAHFTEEFCCKGHVEGGNPECWDAVHTFELCCGSSKDGSIGNGGTSDTAVGAPSSFGMAGVPDVPPPEAPLVSLGGNKNGEGAAEPACWGGHFTEEFCCDVRAGPFGSPSCWSPPHFTFGRCCPTYVSGIIAAPGIRSPPSAPVFGDGCSGLDWIHCCREPDICFDDHSRPGYDSGYTYDVCCRGLRKFRDLWYHVKVDDPLAECWDAIHALGGKPRIESLSQCLDRGDRFFYLSVPVSLDLDHPNWWQFLGVVCVPNACDVASAAGWLAYRLDPWPRPKAWPKLSSRYLNDTHIQLPPHEAVQRPFRRFAPVWVAVFPTADPKDLRNDHFEFAMLEYHSLLSWRPSSFNLGVIGASLSLILWGSVFHFVGVRSRLSAVSPSYGLRRLGASRGPRRFDVWRLVFGALVVAENVQMHYPFQRDRGMTWCIFRALNSISQNHGLAALMVYLSVRRGQGSCVGNVIGYAARRWAALVPFIAFWTWVYLSILMEDLPLFNAIRSNFVYLWFVKQRGLCMPLKSLVPSLLLIHSVPFGMVSPCHNINVFENYFQVDVLTYALNALMPPHLVGVVSAVLWLSYSRWRPSAGHNNVLSAGLVALAVASALRQVPMWRRQWLSSTLGVVGICVGMLLEDIEWFYAATWVSISGLLLLIHRPFPGDAAATSDSAPGRRGHWSLLAALARLAPGINLANIFVIGMHRGLDGGDEGVASEDSLLPESAALFFELFLRVCGFSLGVSICVFFLVEHPVAVLIFGDGHLKEHADGAS
eukprot:TRINITY_DN49285_c0_g1_i1.p1 TRINITY_DN49285_c0_g1~~TRINITY_DN49285_c0_g1_i1.p1  ORF type:complete len:803 (-),score=83.96 TRINITY_DN49285_c0_g1_i1:45-2453(-)